MELKARVGDTIVVESEKVGQPSRTGVIEEVLAEVPPRLRIRWQDGHITILSPSAGGAKVEPGT